MPTLNIQGINVEFPFEPYPCQINYMNKVIEALLTNNNALLESPTGTGKTLCLLCATLAWQNNEKKLKSNKINIGYNLPSQLNININISNNGGISKVIIYASRTHSQISQVINELRSTGYNPKMTVMASREQLCVNERISKTLKGGALNHACNKLTAQRSCMFKNNLENYTGNTEAISGGTSVLDIENLVSIGRQDAICPYFYSRENATKSELVLLPYNYLIDASIRSTLRGIDWQDACIIIDEAHNLEQVASDASSFSLTTIDIATCINELQNVIRLLQIQDAILSSNNSSDKNKQNNDSSNNSNNNSNNSNNRGYGEKPNLQQCAIILRSLFNLEEEIAKLEILSQKSGPVTMTDGSKCLVLPGHWLIRKLEEIGLPVSTCVRTCDEIRLASDFLLDDINIAMGGARTGAIQEPKLAHLGQCLAKIYKGRDLNECIRQASDYSIFIKEETIKSSGNTSISSGKAKRIINYWCFSPGVAMEELKRLGVRSILLTSGTLSPMEAFKEDLKIPFNIVLENPHVISENQVWISAISNGPNNKVLNSSYERRDTLEYKRELGMSILQICRSMKGLQSTPTVINLSGGVLVFFPSYGTLDSAVSCWKSTGIWEDISMAIGHIVIENRGIEKVAQNNQKLNRSKGENYETTNFLSSNSSRQMGTIEEFETSLQNRGSCMLLAVCRGKVSEGIDFRDSKGRIVIITGIPFAPHMDPWIVLKKQHLDETIQSKGTLQTVNEYSPQVQAQKLLSGTSSTVFLSSSSSSLSNNSTNNSSQNRLSGQSWYIQSASRAVNQAMGRVIRHKKDWGIIFLLDSRFQVERQISQLSKWLRPRLKKYNQFPTAIQNFRQFSLLALTNPELQITNKTINQGKIRDSRIVPAKFRQHNNNDNNDNKKTFSNISKEVIINASDLLNNNNNNNNNENGNGGDNDIDDNGDGLNGYIDPSLLLSQGTYDKKFSSSGFELKTSTITNYNSESQDFTSENDISVILSQAKSHPSSSLVSSLSPSNEQNVNLRNRSIAHVFSKSGDEIISSTKPINRTNKSLNKLVMNSETTLSEKLRNNSSSINNILKKLPPSKFDYKKPVGLQSSDIFSSSQLDDNNVNVNNSNNLNITPQSKNVNQTGIRSFITQKSNISQESSKSQSSQSSQLSQTNNNQSSKELFKQKMGQLQSEISDNSYNQLRTELKKFAALSKQNVEINPGHIRQFVNNLIQIFSTEVSPIQLQKSMEIFSILVPENYTELYNTSSNKSIQYLSASSSSSSNSLVENNKSQNIQPKKRTTTDSILSQSNPLPIPPPPKTTTTTTTSVFSNELLAQESRASKRAKLMQSTATSNVSVPSSSSLIQPTLSSSSSSTRSTVKTLLSTVDSINLSKNTSNDSIQNNQQEILKKIMCIICKASPPKIPCVSPCGHICCEYCWEEWLNVKLVCPMCRMHTMHSDISRIRVAP